MNAAYLKQFEEGRKASAKLAKDMSGAVAWNKWIILWISHYFKPKSIIKINSGEVAQIFLSGNANAVWTYLESILSLLFIQSGPQVGMDRAVKEMESDVIL